MSRPSMSRARQIAEYDAAMKLRNEQIKTPVPVVPTQPYADVPERAFGGETYEPPEDGSRLRQQLGRVRDLMGDGEWRTLDQIAAATGGDPPASVSARLRDLRKPKFGRHTVERERVPDGNGLHRYRLILNPLSSDR